MTEFWMGWCAPSARGDLMRALKSISPFATLILASDAADLRERFAWEEPGTVGAIVGLSDRGVSDENLAAALAADGRASEVVLVTREAAGSLRSRMARAGVGRVIEVPAHGAAGRQPAPGTVPDCGPDASGVDGAGGGRPERAARAHRVPSLPEVPKDVHSGKPGLEVPPSGHAARASGQAWMAEGLREGGEAGTASGTSAPVPGPMRGDGARIGPSGSSAPILTLVSGRGGVGKSALAALSACVAAGWGMGVAVLDLDLSCGNLRSFFGLGRGSDLALMGEDPSPDDLRRLCVHAAQGVDLWGPCERPEMAERAMPAVGRLIGHAARTHDLVIIDASTTFTDAVAQAVQASDRVIVVGDGRPGSLASSARCASLILRLGVVRTRIVRARNFCDPREHAGAAIEPAPGSLEGIRCLEIFDGGEEAEELLASGHASDLAREASDMSGSVASALAKTLSDLGRLPDTEQARKAAAAGGRKRKAGLFSRRKEAS